jgi:hypothetical protein
VNERSPEAQRLIDARDAAAIELGLPVKDWRVRRYALLALQFEDIEIDLASGAKTDTDKLIKLDASMQEIKASLPPQQVELVIVRSMICPECKAKRPMTAEEQSQQQSSQGSPPASENAIEAKNNNHRSTASASPTNGKPKPEVRPYHETMQRDSRPGALINGGGSLVWHTGARNGGSAW